MSVRMSVSLSARVFHEIWHSRIFWKSVKEIQISLKSDSKTGNLHADLCKLIIISRWIRLRTRNISGKSCRRNQNTHVMLNNFFRKSWPLWDDAEKHSTVRDATRDNIIRRKKYARIRKHAPNTRVGTLIVATIYLQLIQNRYMFRSFTVLQCSHQHCVQPVASDVEVVGYL